MENAKQKAIELAYGELYDKRIDENGWAYYQLNEERQIIKGISPVGMSVEFNNFKQDNANLIFYWRPKSLAGIETNNNWTVINSEDDLPKEEYELYFVFGENVSVHQCIYHEGIKDYWLKHFSNWQSIIKPSKPIY